MRATLRLAIFAAVVASTLLAARSYAAEPDQPVTARREIVGFEGHFLSLGVGDHVDQPADVGLGGMLRVGRQFWSNAYWTPLELGLFLGRGMVSARLLTEGGLILNSRIGVFELGLGAGVGGLGIATDQTWQCDGTCHVGGAGVILSPVARYLFRQQSSFPMAMVVRGEIPLFPPKQYQPDSHDIQIDGYGISVLAGLEIAYTGKRQ